MSRGWLACALLLGSSAAAAGTDPWAQPTGPVAPGRTGPALEVSGSTARVALPAIPSFAVPTWAGGLHHPLELLVAGGRLRGSKVRVGGYITWISDCAAAFARPGEPHARVPERIDGAPPSCGRPRFTLGGARDTPPDRSLWIVDVPRPDQRERLPAGERARRSPDPALTVGAYVEVTGTFAIRSPQGDVHPDGLIVYEAIDATRPGPPELTLTLTPEAPLPAMTMRARPARTPPPASAGDSIRHARAGDRAYASQQYDTAIAEYEAAVRAWSGNAAAWYGLAGARSWRGNDRAAAAAAERCVALVPDQAMYWLLYGRLLYEAATTEARDREARARGRRADRVTIDRSAIDGGPALEALLAATHLEDQLWRAHYYIGRILGDRGDARAAAEQLSLAIAQHAWEPAPYIALAELYRRWRYPDEALAIAEVGTTAVPDSADLWYELGAARNDLGEPSAAIAAFTRALELEPGLAAVRFQRGQAYVRVKDFAHARRDLEAFVEAGGSSFELDQARRMLASIAGSRR